MQDRRAHCMGVLAKARLDELEAAFASVPEKPAYTWLRPPETGLVMVRARAGGTGAKFNLGEMPVTRCALKTEDGVVGHAYVQGRSHRHAELAALIDAMLLAGMSEIGSRVISPLAQARAARAALAQAQAAATRVEFFTLVRGENP
ncbi:MAG: phosphonate C-P lyase system protein PhnG [Burkholderiales bacterium]